MARTSTRLTRIALLVALTTGLSSLGSTAADAGTLTLRGRMYRATNTSRTYHAVRRVDIQYELSKLARKHSIAMANRGYIFHTANPAAHYLDGIHWSTWGENVGVTPGTVNDLEQAFMNSDAHRANILNRGFRRVAIGTYRDADGWLWVTVFFYG
jgi:uncharacterized protein YkwD